ncbi:hypothetical protein HS088_TW03G00301 [Tripterygium wilfordii]|uniref:C2H2-type domain-containing protein n=1 Tax=Tripterygium wilfordii TaxID=458696 RepID=A0A7J7DUJ6_TRIWF|nr:uncharacterized protein LOC119987114 isoform X2 [Tripterygium wilfordii]KAF5749973.1 hypothetical protein HS088_TW03G00301 [Tripterygium wilfordii]
MIKRRFYRLDYGDNSDGSDSSRASSSDSEVEVEEASEGSEGEVNENAEPRSTSSGYESEDSSGNEIGVDASDEDDNESGKERKILVHCQLSGKHEPEMPKKLSKITHEKVSVPEDMPDCIMKSKSVFKCRLCPRIVCLTEETMRAHLNSKRHGRSEKLLKEGRLTTMLNSDGEIENQETPMEMNARIIALAEKNPKKKSKGRQRQRKRSRRMVGVDSNVETAKQSTKISPLKRKRGKK